MEQERFRALSLRDKQPNPTSETGKSYFLGIGIDRYLHFPRLYNAVKDVRDMVQVLTARYDVDQVLECYDDQATWQTIMQLLEQVKKMVTPNDKLLIYFSGHGHLDEDKLGYWIPHDAGADSSVFYIRNSTLQDFIRVIPAKHILLISDSCYSASLFYSGGSRAGEVLESLESYGSRWAFCSGRQNQKVADGKAGHNSPFAKNILQVLHQNQEAGINIQKLAGIVMEATGANYDQLPEANPIQQVGHQGGQYVFRLKNHRQTLHTPLPGSPQVVRAPEPSDHIEVLGIRFVRVPAGTSPLGTVNFGDFYLAECPLSAVQWHAILPADGDTTAPESPKVNISIEDIEHFLARANEQLPEGQEMLIPHIDQLQYCIDFAGPPATGLEELRLKQGRPSPQKLYDLIGVLDQVVHSREDFYQAIGGSYVSTFRNWKPGAAPLRPLFDTFSRDPLIGFRPLLTMINYDSYAKPFTVGQRLLSGSDE